MFGDIDHPSFAAAFLGRVLTAAATRIRAAQSRAYLPTR
jgi:hypothetical protein